MQILYTGASKQGGEQLNPDTSLGNRPSGSQVPNDSLSNIFSVASLLSIQNKRRETKMVALYNNDLDNAINLTLTFSKEINSICSYKIAFVRPTVNGTDNCFEQIANPTALPYYATFSPIVDGSVFNLSSLEPKSYLGIWLTREYDYTSDSLKKKNCTDWLNLLTALDTDPTAADLPIDETLSFTLNYDLTQNSISNPPTPILPIPAPSSWVIKSSGPDGHRWRYRVGDDGMPIFPGEDLGV